MGYAYGRRRRGVDDGNPQQPAAQQQEVMAASIQQQETPRAQYQHQEVSNIMQQLLHQTIAKTQLQLTEKMQPPKDLFLLTQNKKYNVDPDSGKIIFPDDDRKISPPRASVSGRRRRRRRARRDLSVSSAPISVGSYQISSNRPNMETQTVRFPDSSEGLPPAYRQPFGRHEDATDHRSRYQRLDCEDKSGRSDADHFGLLMLEGALAEDEAGCGLSLICEIGRTPVTALPPKAMGLRRILT